MNKIRGSFIAKLIAWVICISCPLGVVAFGYLAVAGAAEGYYNMTREEVLEEAYRNANAVYSAEAYENMRDHRNQKTLTAEGFRYGIFQTEDIAKEDFRDKSLYIDTNMTEEELQNMDKANLYLYELCEYANGGSKGSFYGCVSDWEDLSVLEKITGHLEEQNEIVWNSQYADAVCYDTTKGIFYYRSEEYYYPVEIVSLYYTDRIGITKEYNYIYDYGKEKYLFNYSDADIGISAAQTGEYSYSEYDVEVDELENQQIALPEERIVERYDADSGTTVTQHYYETGVAGIDEALYSDGETLPYAVEMILRGEGTEGYVDFSKLNQTAFRINNWDVILLDHIREIEGRELTLIDSGTIDKKYFITSNYPEYYLDENYTLYVGQEAAPEYYWIVSLIPDITQPVPEGSKYQATAIGVELFYKYGNNACVVAIFFAIMILVSFVFLVYACGYRKDKEGIVLTWFDKLPLEVISTAVFFVELVPICIIGAIATENSRIIVMNLNIFIPLVTSAIIVFCAIALWYVLGLCVRIKYGKWWRNTICYKACSFVWRAVRKLFDNITLLWKLILFVFIKAVIELFVLAACTADGGLIFLWLIETVLLSAAAFGAALQINELQKAAEKMAGGNLGYKVRTEKMFSICKTHGENLNKIGEGLSKAVDERIKSERFKTELITNVSHDIKTPLTSIINYVDLLEKEELHNEKAEEYLAVLERQSSKLKKLIEDLVEASKASTGNLEVGNELLEAGVFLTQTVGEFEEKLSLVGLELIVQKPEEPLYILADGRHLWRVVDNLMNNICKYAQPSSRVYVNLEKEEEEVVMTFRNISKYQLNINGSELTERFVRGDSSRNTEGHGLGLSIAKSLMDLIGGDMRIVVDGDLFKVILRFALQKEGPRNDEQDAVQEDAE
ncbi:MAG: HAMP domain-containing histidine kinase [Lachnospiraceae bacterium]|nr:HAMP domain-containing histidine kinase [Lachnospiraceae bacterium]